MADWLWGILIGFLTWYSLMNILLSTYILRAFNKFESDKAETVKQRYLIVIIIWGIVYVATLICFFAIPDLLQHQSWTIPMACIGSGLALLTYSSQKVTALRDVEEREHLVEKELEHETKDMTDEEKEQFAKDLYDHFNKDNK